MKWLGALAGIFLSCGIGSEIAPHANISNVVAIVIGSALLGFVIGSASLHHRVPE